MGWAAAHEREAAGARAASHMLDELAHSGTRTHLARPSCPSCATNTSHPSEAKITFIGSQLASSITRCVSRCRPRGTRSWKPRTVKVRSGRMGEGSLVGLDLGSAACAERIGADFSALGRGLGGRSGARIAARAPALGRLRLVHPQDVAAFGGAQRRAGPRAARTDSAERRGHVSRAGRWPGPW